MPEQSLFPRVFLEKKRLIVKRKITGVIAKLNIGAIPHS